MHHFFKFSLVTIIFFMSNNLSYSAESDTHHTDWRFNIAPYLWAINLNGTVANGPLESHVSESFSELMHHFNGGGMLWVDAYKGRLGFFVNGLYTDLTDHDNIGLLDAKLKVHFGILSGGASYIVLQQPWANKYWQGQMQLEPYLGARYTFNHVNLNLDPISLTTSSDQGWTDILLGLRYRNDFNAHWTAVLSGDVGGKTGNSHSYNLIGLVGYKLTHPAFDNYTLYLGYRYLYQHYSHGEGTDFFEWKMKLFGPIVGASLAF